VVRDKTPKKANFCGLMCLNPVVRASVTNKSGLVCASCFREKALLDDKLHRLSHVFLVELFRLVGFLLT